MRVNRGTSMYMSLDGTSLKKMAVFFITSIMIISFMTGMLTSIKPQYRISSSSLKDWTTHFNGASFMYLLGFENAYFAQVLPAESKPPGLSALAFEMATSINPNDPRSLLGNELPGFATFDSEIIVAGEGTNYTNMPYESSPPMDVLLKEREATVNQPTKQNPGVDSNHNNPPALSTNGKKVVFIYHTHTRESFLPHLEKGAVLDEAYHSKVNVTLLGERLGGELQKRGIGNVVDKTDFTDVLLKKGWKYPRSYDASRPTVQQALANNKDLSFLFDIHRDSKRKKDTTVNINGQAFARTAFVIGAEHPNYELNLKLAKDLHHRLDQQYPGLSRGVTTKQGPGTNGKFNQDLSENAIVIEFGGVDNTLEELYRTVEAVAEVFSDYYWGMNGTKKS